MNVFEIMGDDDLVIEWRNADALLRRNGADEAARNAQFNCETEMARRGILPERFVKRRGGRQ